MGLNILVQIFFINTYFLCKKRFTTIIKLRLLWVEFSIVFSRIDEMENSKIAK